MSNIKFTVEANIKVFLENYTHLHFAPSTKDIVGTNMPINDRLYNILDHVEFADSDTAEFEEPDELREFFVD